MAAVKAREIQQSDILRIEAEMNNLWGELNTCNIPYFTRMEVEQKLGGCEEQFKSVLGGQSSIKELEAELHQCDMKLAQAVIQQAANEIPKTEHSSSFFLALESIKRQLGEGNISAVKARHEVKEMMRHKKYS